MTNILKQNSGKILILSGEGIQGTFEEYRGKRTERALGMKLKKDSCHGDRWAKAYIYLHNDENGDPVYMNLENTNDMTIVKEF